MRVIEKYICITFESGMRKGSCSWSQWCQAPLGFYKQINPYLQTKHKVIDL